jgi:hypothetical protein
MKVGDLVKIIGSHGEGPEVTSAIGVIMEPWKIDEWWVVMMPNQGTVHWPESQMMKVNNESR